MTDQLDDGGHNPLGIGATCAIGYDPSVDLAICTDSDRDRAIGGCRDSNFFRQRGSNVFDICP
ncbi:hypothetical protein [Nocardia yunnanensis]|uniref:hypothetical protein n=1 Tax=Nocardia yunnanensis TaxID=2382165 RepID=UPI0013C52771|nr:hypothetical protein [Nocardia yunnanensis]